MQLYNDLYRCESCSDLLDPHGVAPFTKPGNAQTIPVSHFGNIDESLIWVVFNNPKGDRNDQNVGATPRQFGAIGRSTLSEDDIQRVKDHFNQYFKMEVGCHDFFKKWEFLLNGLRVIGKTVTFENGGICAVDLIKCPTVESWMGFVMKPEGKKVWDNCLRRPDGNRFLLKQIDYHKPAIIILAGTQSCVKKQWKGGMNRELSCLVSNEGSILIKRVFTNTLPRRLSLGLCAQRQIELLKEDDLQREKIIIQLIIDQWSETL